VLQNDFNVQTVVDICYRVKRTIQNIIHIPVMLYMYMMMHVNVFYIRFYKDVQVLGINIALNIKYNMIRL